MITFEFTVVLGILAVAIFALAIAIMAYPGPKRSSRGSSGKK